MLSPQEWDMSVIYMERLADATERLAEHFAPADEGLQHAEAMLSGAYIGFADNLEEILETSKNDFEKSSRLRELVERVRKIADNYAKKQAEKDQARQGVEG